MQKTKVDKLKIDPVVPVSIYLMIPYSHESFITGLNLNI